MCDLEDCQTLVCLTTFTVPLPVTKIVYHHAICMTHHVVTGALKTMA